MSFSKVYDLINTSTLYFCRLDCFREKEKLEGTQPDGSLQFAYDTDNPWQKYEWCNMPNLT